MPEQTIHILHLEDDTRDCELVQEILASEGVRCEIDCVQTGEEFYQRLMARQPDLIISDFSMPSYDGMRALRLSREIAATVPFIFFSGTLGEETAVASLKDGATDYVLKQRPGRLVPAVRRAMSEVRERRRRRLAEEQLREHAALLNEARDAICLQDLDQRILFWNKSAERLYGWKSEEAIGRDANELLIQDAVALAACKELIQRGHWQGELQQVTRSGEALVVESRWSLIRDSSDAPKSILVINTDITEKKSMEAQYLRAQRMESIGMLAGGIAHDLNNVLSPILMSGELLLDLAGEPSRPLLETIVTSAQRGTDLVRQILSFARGADGEKAMLDFSQVVNEVATLIFSTFPHSITLQMNVPGDLPPLCANSTQLHQVILNLCVNARDAMPDGGSITIGARAVTLQNHRSSFQSDPLNGPFMELKVTDTGGGIPADVLPKIFEPFFTTKDVSRGTGLGLTTVIGIVRGHGGSLEVTTQRGRGTTFTLFFPILAKYAGAANEVILANEIPGRNECILCVDDEPGVLDITRKALVHAGYRVMLARDGAEAFALFQEHQHEIDLVITDMMMPVVHGPALIMAVRELRPEVKIIAVSGVFAAVKLPEGQRNSVDAILHKPYTLATLVSTIQGVFAEASSSAGE